MQIDFTKIHGTGNDFIMIDDLSREIDLSADQVAWLCDRHFGVGADGVILIRPSEHDDCVAYMHYINADGTLAEMCGNGVRCFAKYLVDKGFVTSDVCEDGLGGSFIADTKAGKRPITFTADADGKLVQATVNMGKPSLEGVVMVSTPYGNVRATKVNMGNPHAVISVNDIDGVCGMEASGFASEPSYYDIHTLGQYLENLTSEFPNKTNVEFVAVGGADGASGANGITGLARSLVMRVWERGVGETLACGTGACAAVVALANGGLVQNSSDVRLAGGVLHIDWRDDGYVYLTGPATTVYEGELDV
jgi:diaminopimelate epimerase